MWFVGATEWTDWTVIEPDTTTAAYNDYWRFDIRNSSARMANGKICHVNERYSVDISRWRNLNRFTQVINARKAIIAGTYKRSELSASYKLTYIHSVRLQCIGRESVTHNWVSMAVSQRSPTGNIQRLRGSVPPVPYEGHSKVDTD